MTICVPKVILLAHVSRSLMRYRTHIDRRSSVVPKDAFNMVGVLDGSCVLVLSEFEEPGSIEYEGTGEWLRSEPEQSLCSG